MLYSSKTKYSFEELYNIFYHDNHVKDTHQNL